MVTSTTWLASTAAKNEITIDGDELIRVVDSPNGTPVSGKVSIDALKNYVSSEIDATYLTEVEAAATYQPLDADLTTLGAGGTGARDFLSLGTANSPQFTGIELGHATDTTLARVAAGRASIEGRDLAFRLGVTATDPEYAAIGNGTADDETAIDAFLTAAAGTIGTIPAGSYKLTNASIGSASHIAGIGRHLSTIKRDVDGATLLAATGVDGITISDLAFDLDYTTNGDSGHGVSIGDSDYLDLRYLRANNFGNNGGAAGTGFLAFASTGTVRNISFDHLIAIADDSDSDNTNGMLIASGRYCSMTSSYAEGAIAFGIEYKNDTRYSVLATSVAVDCGYGFGYGQDTVADDGCDFNAAGILVTYACDFGLILGEADYNLFAGLVVDSTDAPNRLGDGNVYGARIADLSDGNVVSHVLSYGANMDYPIRIGGDRNYASVASHDAASQIVTFDSGAVKNFVELLHPGTRTTIASSITDNSGVDADSTDANVVHSPATGEYYGSMSGRYHWRLMSSGASAASNHLWRYETDGSNIIGFLSPGSTGENYGFAINIAGTSNYASHLYIKGSTGPNDYWQWRANNANQLRLYDGVLRPEVDNDISLGTASVAYSDIFLGSGAVIGFNNGDVTITHSSNALTIAGGYLVPGLADYADDAAAATGGVPVGGLYRTTGAVKVRVS